jgi:hypothetical protein
MTRRFSKRVLAAVDESSVLRIRAGADDTHRFLGIWGVVAQGRIFVRPWNDKPTGWRQAFLADPRGAIRLAKDGPDIRVHAKPVRGERVNDAVDAAYKEKYASKANSKWVRGLVTAKRRKTTMELVLG